MLPPPPVSLHDPEFQAGLLAWQRDDLLQTMGLLTCTASE